MYLTAIHTFYAKPLTLKCLLLDYIKTYSSDWSGGGNGEYRVRRQLSVSSDSKLLDESVREDARVVMRPKRPPRPKSEAFLGPHQNSNRRTKRFSAFGVSIYYNCFYIWQENDSTEPDLQFNPIAMEPSANYHNPSHFTMPMPLFTPRLILKIFLTVYVLWKGIPFVNCETK